MNSPTASSSNEFLTEMRPVLETQDLRGMLRLLQQRWPVQRILNFLNCTCCDARKVAAMSLAWVGSTECIEPLVQRLKDPDPVVHQMAEHALWSIWLRGGNKTANRWVCRAIRAMETQDNDLAIRCCDSALKHSPEFSEAYNQRAIAHYLKEDYRASIADCKRVIEQMPSHFGAWAGLGHCYAHLGEVQSAISAYLNALAINPNMECVRESVQALHSLTLPS